MIQDSKDNYERQALEQQETIAQRDERIKILEESIKIKNEIEDLDEQIIDKTNELEELERNRDSSISMFQPYSFFIVGCVAVLATLAIIIHLAFELKTIGWLYLLGKYRNFAGTFYLIWCLTETLIASLFGTLYVVLMAQESLPFFEIAGSVYVNVLAITIYPYAFLLLGFALYQRDNEQAHQPDDNSLICFYDEYKKLRLVIAPEAIMFIRSEDNYVQIHYNDRNKSKKFILRSSMRALEEDLSRHGLVRCHRSYFINPLYIKIVHRDETGLIVAKLKQEGFDSIPISRKYQNEITRLL